MYIRRKVFSTFIDNETGEEKLFSTTEIDGMEVKEFSSREQKLLRDKLYMRRGASNSLHQDINNIAQETWQGIKKTAEKTGKGTNTLYRKVYYRNPSGYSAVIRNARREDAALHRDMLQDKTTKEGMESYKKKLMERAKELKAQKVADSISHHKAQADILRAKKLAGQKLAKNLKTAGKVGLGAAALVGGGVVAKKMYDKKKKEDN